MALVLPTLAINLLLNGIQKGSNSPRVGHVLINCHRVWDVSAVGIITCRGWHDECNPLNSFPHNSSGHLQCISLASIFRSSFHIIEPVNEDGRNATSWRRGPETTSQRTLMQNADPFTIERQFRSTSQSLWHLKCTDSPLLADSPE